MGAPGLKLRSVERQRLQRIAKSDQEKPATRTRAMVVLLSHAGQRGQAIADLLGITRRTVTNTRGRRRDGLSILP